jgi:hypothetical protein
MVPNASRNGEEAAAAAWGSVGGALLPSSPPPLRDPARDEGGTIAQLLGSWRTRPKGLRRWHCVLAVVVRAHGIDASRDARAPSRGPAPLIRRLPRPTRLTSPPDCTELVLSRRRLDRLSGLDALVNLEVLFVSGNRLRALTGLDANVRLRELYAEVGGGRRRLTAGRCLAFCFVTIANCRLQCWAHAQAPPRQCAPPRALAAPPPLLGDPPPALHRGTSSARSAAACRGSVT